MQLHLINLPEENPASASCKTCSSFLAVTSKDFGKCIDYPDAEWRKLPDACPRCQSFDVTLEKREGLTRYSYDAIGNRTSLTDPVLNTTAWTYDRLNRATADINTFGDARRFEYDAANNLTRKIDRNGRVTKYTPDNLNRLSKEEWFTDEADIYVNRTITSAFDMMDRLETVTERDGTIIPSPQPLAADYTLAYDYQGNFEYVKADLVGLGPTQNVFLRHTFDNLGRRKDSKASNGTIENFQRDYINTYTYDAVSRLTKVTQDKQGTGTGYNSLAAKRADFIYNAVGQQQKITRYSNLAGSTEVGHTDFDYDEFGRLEGLDHEKSDNSVITGIDYGYDNLNRLLSINLSTSVPGQDYNGEDATYTYDATDQVTKVDRPLTVYDENFTFDLNGNRRIVDLANQQHGPNNRLVRDGYNEYTYDKEGNVTKRVALVSGNPTGATTEFAYDHHNRLVSVTEKTAPTGGTTTKVTGYEYDAFDRRIAKTLDTSPADSTPTRFEFYIWDGDDVVMDWVDADGGTGPNPTLSKRYLWGQATDQILAEETAGGATVWDLADHLGSVRDQVDNTGAYLPNSHVGYSVFGYPGSAPLTRFAYTAQEYDADTGLYYYNARWYDPVTGRYMSIDPIGFAAGDANLMRYVGNSPTNATDPTGMVTQDELDTYFKMLYGEEGAEFLNAFRKADGTVVIEPWMLWGDDFDLDALYTHTGDPTIQINDKLDPVTAAQRLYEALLEAALLSRVRLQFTIDGTDECAFNFLLENYRESYRRAANASAIAARLYLSGLAITNEGADIVLTLHDLSEGDWTAAVGLLPLLPNGITKVRVKAPTGKVIEVDAAAVRKVQEFLLASRLGGSKFQGSLSDAIRDLSEVVPGLKYGFMDMKPNEFGKFDDTRNMIIFNGNRTGVDCVTLADEMQHALDFERFRLTRQQLVDKIKATTKIGPRGMYSFYHRRIFTRAIKNIHDGTPGFAHLKPYLDEIYDAYLSHGGELTKQQIFDSDFTEPF